MRVRKKDIKRLGADAVKKFRELRCEFYYWVYIWIVSKRRELRWEKALREREYREEEERRREEEASRLII